MKLRRSTLAVSTLAHLLAWIAFLWLVFWPSFYQGTSVVSTGPGGVIQKETQLSASIVETNGRGVLIPLLVPVIFTALGLLTIVNRNYADRRNKVMLWAITVLLVLFCGVGMFSIGMFYLPAALAMILGAALVTVGSRKTPRPAARRA